MQSTRIAAAGVLVVLTIGCGFLAVKIDAGRESGRNKVAVSQDVKALRASLSGRMRSALSKVEDGKYEEAREIAEKLQKGGDVHAAYLLGFLNENGLGGPKDKAASIELYKIAADAGISDAQHALGAQSVARGRYDEGIKLLTKAARQDHPLAQARLGALYAEGRGIPANQDKAFHWFQKAADQENVDGLAGVGIAYLTGAGVPLNYKKSAAAFEKAARLGHGQSQYNLALLYDSKLLGEPDGEKVLYWMSAAARSGLPSANVALGLMFHESGAKGKDGEQPADFFAKAAEAGDPQGMFLYAVALSEGDGREKDEGAAVFWLDSVMAAHDASRDLKSNASLLRSRLAGDPGAVLGGLTLRD